MYYQMQTIEVTRLRDDHNTASNTIIRVPAGTTVTGIELFTAPSMLSNAVLGVYQSAGDKWLRVTHAGVTGWMAYIHQGQKVCTGFVEITEPTPPAASEIPAYFDLTTPDGVKTRYNRA